jgi:hypothetical protein
MKSLTKKEIRDELLRLGIKTPEEIESFLKEYDSYISSQKEMFLEIQNSLEAGHQGYDG